jgi:hypothetical protein
MGFIKVCCNQIPVVWFYASYLQNAFFIDNVFSPGSLFYTYSILQKKLDGDTWFCIKK